MRIAGSATGSGRFTRYTCAPDRRARVTVAHRAWWEWRIAWRSRRGHRHRRARRRIASHMVPRLVSDAREAAVVGGVVLDGRSSRSLAGRETLRHLDRERHMNRSRSIKASDRPCTGSRHRAIVPTTACSVPVSSWLPLRLQGTRSPDPYSNMGEDNHDTETGTPERT